MFWQINLEKVDKNDTRASNFQVLEAEGRLKMKGSWASDTLIKQKLLENILILIVAVLLDDFTALEILKIEMCMSHMWSDCTTVKTSNWDMPFSFSFFSGFFGDLSVIPLGTMVDPIRRLVLFSTWMDLQVRF